MLLRIFKQGQRLCAPFRPQRAKERQCHWQSIHAHDLRSPLAADDGSPIIAVGRTLTTQLREHLEIQGNLVVRVAKNRDALARLVPGAGAILLAEWQDLELSGLALCRRVRRHRRFAKVAIILVSDHCTPVDRIAGLAAGASYVIDRPFMNRYWAPGMLMTAPRGKGGCENASALSWSEPAEDRFAGMRKEALGRVMESHGKASQDLGFPSGVPCPLTMLEKASDLHFHAMRKTWRHWRKYWTAIGF